MFTKVFRNEILNPSSKQEFEQWVDSIQLSFPSTIWWRHASSSIFICQIAQWLCTQASPQNGLRLPPIFYPRFAESRNNSSFQGFLLCYHKHWNGMESASTSRSIDTPCISMHLIKVSASIVTQRCMWMNYMRNRRVWKDAMHICIHSRKIHWLMILWNNWRMRTAFDTVGEDGGQIGIKIRNHNEIGEASQQSYFLVAFMMNMRSVWQGWPQIIREKLRNLDWKANNVPWSSCNYGTLSVFKEHDTVTQATIPMPCMSDIWRLVYNTEDFKPPHPLVERSGQVSEPNRNPTDSPRNLHTLPRISA